MAKTKRTKVTQTDPSALEVVEKFLRALERMDVEEAMSLLDDGVVYQNVPLPPDHGKEATARTLKSFLRFSDRFEARIHSIAERDGVVLTERTDVIAGPGIHLEFWVCGRFEVRDGVITLWRDYFDWMSMVGQVAKNVPGFAIAGAKTALGRLTTRPSSQLTS